MRPYNHLSQDERDLISIGIAQGHSLRTIAKNLQRSPATLLREIRRNGTGGVYLPHLAHGRADQRNRQSRRRPRLKNAVVRQAVEEGLKKRWSPELIAGRLRRQGTPISHEAIYQWIYAKASYLRFYLLRCHPVRWHKGQRRQKQVLRIPGRRSIRERPKVINRRQEFGHWEADTVLSARSKAVLQIAVERRARYVKLRRLEQKNGDQMWQGLFELLSPFPSFARKSVTYDNGTENCRHERLNAALGTESYFCEPYHSWEKGTVENTAGLARRFFPKTTDFSKVTDQAIAELESWLNKRPRKCLNYRTPEEAFQSEGVALAP